MSGLFVHKFWLEFIIMVPLNDQTNFKLINGQRSITYNENDEKVLVLLLSDTTLHRVEKM